MSRQYIIFIILLHIYWQIRIQTINETENDTRELLLIELLLTDWIISTNSKFGYYVLLLIKLIETNRRFIRIQRNKVEQPLSTSTKLLIYKVISPHHDDYWTELCCETRLISSSYNNRLKATWGTKASAHQRSLIERDKETERRKQREGGGGGDSGHYRGMHQKTTRPIEGSG